MNDHNNNNLFLDELVKRAFEHHKVMATYWHSSNPERIKIPQSLMKILELDQNQLSKLAYNTLTIFEDENTDIAKENWIDFKWKLTAFKYIQDVFTGPLFRPEENYQLIFHLWYFYYESKHILTESILCGLNGFYVASWSLLRNFLEFNISQNYFFLNAHELNSYKSLENYFLKGIKPGWNLLVNKCLPQDKFAKPIKKRIHAHLKALSRSTSHSYQPEFSSRQYTGYKSQPTLEGIYFWEGIRMILQCVLWIYYVNFPMLFHPKDILIKFGFSPPVGIFIDSMCGNIIERSMTPKDYEKFKNHSSFTQETTDLNNWYASFANLSDDDIRNTWDSKLDGELKEIIEGYCKNMAKMRVIKEAMALRKDEYNARPDEIPSLYMNLMTYDKWVNI